MPAGVTLTANADGTATLAGTPATGTQGTYPFTITAANAISPDATQSFTLTVNQVATTTTLIASPNPSVFGQTVTFVAQVANTSGTGPVPDGVVRFYDGTTQIGGDAPLGPTGLATVTTSNLGADTEGHSITAVYLGSGNFNSSTSSILIQIVNSAPTITRVTAVPMTATFGQGVTLTATIDTLGIPLTSNPNLGRVRFWDGDPNAGGVPISESLAVPESATVSTTVNVLDAGQHMIFAGYTGNYDFLGSQGSVPFVVAKSATNTTLTTSLNPSRYGLNVTYIATVQASGNPYQPTTGTVQFWCGATWIGTASLNDSSQASLTVAALNCGSHAITATYVGSDNFLGSTSPILSQQVNQNQTVVRLGCAIAEPTEAPAVLSASPAAAARVHRQVVFTILVHPAGAPAFLATEGTATIYQSNGRFVATLPVRNGQATLNRYLCQVFQKSYYAVYNGTANLARARSNMVRVTMSPVIAGAQSTPPVIAPKVTPHAPKATLALALHAKRVAVLRRG